jgi:hypothetical protein
MIMVKPSDEGNSRGQTGHVSETIGLSTETRRRRVSGCRS